MKALRDALTLKRPGQTMKLGDLRLSDLMRLLQADDAPAPEYRPEYRPVDPPALPEAYQRLSVRDCRIRLRELQREAAQRASNGRSGSAESREWAGLASHYRMALVLLAGIDGEIEELALRDWREMPPPERDAIRRQIRALRTCLLPLRALALRT
ncbi:MULTISPECIES: hypothetical protein [Delftia]|uniref:DUF3348 family protein n=3 Tax=Delftia TaxID=80865 RepID=A0ABN4SE83_9BURK|nr:MULTISPECIES: hypothetical protein [Delftia]AOV01907.1 hypothetical protein BI380_11350 [Delftia tsuruhatensis]BDE72854.1 hypothetical protein HQS1_39780 [Delftia lacustris]SDZ38221.1 hypothetical protein SAMN05421547_1217 [Delftia lacustris]